MSTTVTVNGTDYSFPTRGEKGWHAAVKALVDALGAGVTANTAAAAAAQADADAAQTTANSASTAAATAQSEVDALETVVGTPTNANTPSQIVKRDANGDSSHRDLSARKVTATTVAGDVLSATTRVEGAEVKASSTFAVSADSNGILFDGSVAAGNDTVTVVNTHVTDADYIGVMLMTPGSGVSLESVVPANGSFDVTLTGPAPSGGVAFRCFVVTGR